MIQDPGPVPERGIAVRAVSGPFGDGFYARLYPRPALPARVWGPALAGALIVGGGVAGLFGTDWALRGTIFASIGLFTALLVVFAHGAGFVPVEITVDDRQVSWGGERHLLEVVTDCVAEGSTLELRGPGDRVLERLENLRPEAARWVSLAIRASLPEALSPSPAGGRGPG